MLHPVGKLRCLKRVAELNARGLAKDAAHLPSLRLQINALEARVSLLTDPYEKLTTYEGIVSCYLNVPIKTARDFKYMALTQIKISEITRNNLETAKQTIQNGLVQYPENARLVSTLAFILYREALALNDNQKRELLVEAEKHARKAADEVRNDLRPLLTYALILAEGNVTKQDKALKHLSYIISKFPKNIEALYALAKLHLCKENYFGATLHLKGIVKLLPNNASYKCELGQAYLEWSASEIESQPWVSKKAWEILAEAEQLGSERAKLILNRMRSATPPTLEDGKE